MYIARENPHLTLKTCNKTTPLLLMYLPVPNKPTSHPSPIQSNLSYPGALGLRNSYLRILYKYIGCNRPHLLYCPQFLQCQHKIGQISCPVEGGARIIEVQLYSTKQHLTRGLHNQDDNIHTAMDPRMDPFCVYSTYHTHPGPLSETPHILSKCSPLLFTLTICRDVANPWPEAALDACSTCR